MHREWIRPAAYGFLGTVAAIVICGVLVLAVQTYLGARQGAQAYAYIQQVIAQQAQQQKAQPKP